MKEYGQEKEEFDIFYIRMSDFVKLYSENKEMFIFDNTNFKYYFKDTKIEIYMTDSIPKGVKGFLANTKFFKNY